MKTTLKYFCLALVAFVLAFMATPARAQSYGSVTLLSGGTNNVVGAATNSYYTSFAPIDTRYYAGIAISFGGQGFQSTNLGTIFARFKVSLDGTTNTTETIASVRIPLVQTGTTFAVTSTNVTLGQSGFLIFDGIENSLATPSTNLYVAYALNPKRSGF